MQKSTKPTRDMRKTPPHPDSALRRHLRKMERGNRAYYDVVSASVRDDLSAYLRVEQGSAARQPLADNSADIVITSSPYVTSYEYADLHQLSTIWLDLTDDLQRYRERFIGTAHRTTAAAEVRGTIAGEMVQQMQTRSARSAEEIARFFCDMQQVFAESYRILKPGARCCYVIGNTRLKRVEILNAQAFAEGLLLAGFQLEDIITREIPLKILPQTRDAQTGRFASNARATAAAYPLEYIVVGRKP